MGNSESQYSPQPSKSHALLFSTKQKPCSLRLRSIHAKIEQSRSSHGWGNSNSNCSSSNSSGYKARALTRGCISQHKNSQPYSARHCDCGTKSNKSTPNGKHQANSPGSCDTSNNVVLQTENNFCYVPCDVSDECNGYIRNGHSTYETSTSESTEDKSSPKVLIKTLGKFDGSLRVEFTSGGNNNNNRFPIDDSNGPVKLLKYSPTLELTPSNPDIVRRHCRTSYDNVSSLTVGDSGVRTSKGSSLSSDSSWYDSPWGNTVEINEADRIYPAIRTADRSTGESVLHSSQNVFNQRVSPISLQDLYRETNLAPAFAAENGLSTEYLNVPVSGSRTSFVSDTDIAFDIESATLKPFSSFTLPCRKSRPIQEAITKKDTLKSRMRRISDWTGSLTRKKRKLQEPKNKDISECFDSGIDGFTADTSSPSQVSNSVWSPSPGSNFTPRSESSNAIYNSDALRQNIYENFMRELEIGCSKDHVEPSSEPEETSSDSLGSLEQLDLLFEKEQGVVRKAGWLFFKPLITLQKEKKLELAARRKWKQYWVTLKGCTLLFYETYGRNSMEEDFLPRYALFAEDSIVQSVPEHPKKENVFCLSNTFGDVYLFQATSQTDLENWVTAIHSASASLFAKKHGKEDTVRLLRNQTKSFIQKIDMDSKMKKMAEIQLSIVSDPKNRKAIENQIQQWEQNLEKFNMDLFRIRCYLASLRGGELPNPKSLLSAASRPSKVALSRLGIFSVSSFHALICSRDEATLRKRSLSLSQRMKNKRGLFSSLKGLDSITKRGKEKRPSVSQIFENTGSQRTSFLLNPNSCERLDGSSNVCSTAPPEDSVRETAVYLPENQKVTVVVRLEHKVEDVLALVCKMKQLDPAMFCLRLKRIMDGSIDFSVPAFSEYIHELTYDEIEVLPVSVYHILLEKTDTDGDFGFSIVAKGDELHKSHILVTEVLPDGFAFSKGLRQGDEILVINGKTVSTLDPTHIRELFSEQSLLLTLKRVSNNDDKTDKLVENELKDSNSKISTAKQSQLLEEFFDKQMEQKTTDVTRVPDITIFEVRDSTEDHLEQDRKPTDNHQKSAETAATLYQSFQEGSSGVMEVVNEPADVSVRPWTRHMSATERLSKVIQELVDTEKSYVKDLTCLFEIYLTPLQKEIFLTQDEMESLFGSLPEMLDFQKVFLQTLEERIGSNPDFTTLETPLQFKKLLFSLGGSFLYYADHFKLYSGFCANQIKVQKVLERAKTDRAFKEFLDAKNPTKQHSSTLESYLIKPVQRVLKYPLLLRELVSLTDAESEEHYHLTEALKAMEKVASHINEMQKIYEDFGTVFDQLVAEQSGPEKEVTEISMGEFLMHSSVVWLNPFPSLGRLRKDPELTVFVFKKAVILVYRESNKLKKKMHANTRAAYIHGDLDPFKFRWLIPLSALQVRLGNASGTDTNCFWELVHTKSEIEGRPETVFQLCSSVPETKANTIKAIRSILRESLRRNLKCDIPLEKSCKEHIVPLRTTKPMSARIGSSRASWLSKHLSTEVTISNEMLKGSLIDSDEGSLSSSTQSSGCHTTDANLESSQSTHVTKQKNVHIDLSDDNTVKESDILSDDDDYCETTKKESPTSDIESHFQRLSLSDDGKRESQQNMHVQVESEEPEVQRKQPKLVRAHYCAIRRKGNSLRRNKGILLAMKEHSRSLDSQSESTSLDLNALLEREFSVQSLTSVVNEDCFYETPCDYAKPTTPL
ncbi:rho guanine nucleotide exchange factor TIAM2 isoform X1 [Erpetoichthys calabaricus]|uniref:rho guanine nucleotide exchange factor TIAM2 isoform X1 n=2 Tax=Erpetoichthys calabaricus TaxID=27687 RepID=UPI002234761A|nr:rho guanine nucleotide exchange factor TIAM2 isoform X1 [Erpetoichthys calabaricus]XP_028653250.2 rho guanine nucleotide exchange factor TIAM2 isoform X1 [Erpetoichthys calabaricus]XP_051781115.1 rho guanine nucleotide exchange factor TIAM2 isoform X1 [Erpetoichthys calabaricus]XP_051781116.1 rho guanine nucleotide exchange factor TIAM2 isoform X1 [Erpetoichthys calabaricus]